MVSPSALAVFRLTTRSNLVGCSTGTSATFAPRNLCGGLPRHNVSKELDDVRAVGDQTALLGHFRELVHGRQR